MSEALGIYKKINDIMKKVEFVTKDGVLGFGKNTFTVVTHDKVVSVVRSHFVEAGVIIIPTQVEKGLSVPGQSKSGTAKIRMEALYDVSFIDIEDGSKIVMRSEAHAEDSSDKAANKCITYAVKNALLKVLMLQTGDDVKQELSNKIDNKQRSLLMGLISATDSNLAEFLKAFKVEVLTDLNQEYYTQAVELLQKKQQQQKAK